MANLTVVDHPLIHHKLTLLRRVETETPQFRDLLRQISLLLAFEATRDLESQPKEIVTPMGPMEGRAIAKPPAIVAILRAGLGFVDGFLDVLPEAPVGHVGLARDAETLEAKEYYFKVPDLRGRLTLVLDPMLATANSSIAAVERLRREDHGPMKMVCLVAAPEGIAAFQTKFPDVGIVTAAVDERLNEVGYIVPGLGDAGDRLFGTPH